MKPLSFNEVNKFVNENIVDFHKKRINSLEQLQLVKLLRKNPYLFKAKNVQTAGGVDEGIA